MSQPVQEDVPQVPREEILEHLEAILASRAFSSSDRLRRFLRVIVERTVAGQQDTVKEYSIGIDVLAAPRAMIQGPTPLYACTPASCGTACGNIMQPKRREAACRSTYPKAVTSRFFAAVPILNLCAPTACNTTATGRARRTLKWIFAASIVTLAAFGFAARFLQPARRGPIRSVVFLPFVNRGADSGDKYISDSLTDEVTSALARQTRLQVVGRTSAFTYKGKAADVREIGKTLGVDAVVEGSLRRDEGELRLTVNLLGLPMDISDGQDPGNAPGLSYLRCGTMSFRQWCPFCVPDRRRDKTIQFRRGMCRLLIRTCSAGFTQ